MIKKITPSILSAAAVWLAASSVLAQAPPSGEPPSQAQQEEMARRKKAKDAVPLTIDTRDQILSSLYDKLKAAGDKKSAAEILTAIRTVSNFSGSPTTDLLLDRAEQAIAAKNVPLALRLIDTALDLQPDFPRAYTLRALAHSETGEATRAIDDYRRAIALEPKNVLPYSLLASELLKQNMQKESKEALDTLERLYPKFRDHVPSLDALPVKPPAKPDDGKEI